MTSDWLEQYSELRNKKAELTAENAALKAEVERLRDALQQVKSWFYKPFRSRNGTWPSEADAQEAYELTNVVNTALSQPGLQPVVGHESPNLAHNLICGSSVNHKDKEQQ